MNKPTEKNLERAREIRQKVFRIAMDVTNFAYDCARLDTLFAIEFDQIDEQASIQFGVCSICGFNAWKPREGKERNIEDCQYCKLQNEIERLKAGGCARDQSTTQFCAEAVSLREERDDYKEKCIKNKKNADDYFSALAASERDLIETRKQRDDALERLKELLKSADAEWYVNNGGHDWRDAVLAAESFLAEQKKGEGK